LTIALPPWLGFVVLFVVSVGAVLRGGVEERLTAMALLTNVAVTVALRDHSWPHLQWAGFAVDLLLLVLMVGIALRSPKYWPMAGAGFQLLSVLTHVAKMIDPALHQWAYITAIVIWTYLLIFSLAVGVWNCWRAEAYRVGTGRAPAVDTRR
jgi:hypothetical protein